MVKHSLCNRSIRSLHTFQDIELSLLTRKQIGRVAKAARKGSDRLSAAQQQICTSAYCRVIDQFTCSAKAVLLLVIITVCHNELS